MTVTATPHQVTAACCRTGQIVVRRYKPCGWQAIATGPRPHVLKALRDHARRDRSGAFCVPGIEEAANDQAAAEAHAAFRLVLAQDLDKSLNRQTGGMFQEQTP